MFISSKGYNNPKAIAHVIRYITNELKIEKSDSRFLYTRFVNNRDDLQDVIRAFTQSNSSRQVKRKNTNCIYQDIISFHKKDSHALSTSILKQVARKYVALRCPESQVVVTHHKDQEHQHLHFAIASTCFKSGMATRMSQADFNQAKVEMEHWQDQKLNLTHSRIDHLVPSRKLHNICHTSHRNTLSTKEWLKIECKKQLIQCTSFTRLQQQLNSKDITIYLRNHQPYGVVYRGKKYRLSTLHLPQERILQLFTIEQKLTQIHHKMLQLEHASQEQQKIKHEKKI